MKSVFIVLFGIVAAENECELGTDTCTENEDCFDIPSGFLCACKDGYELTGIGCIDIDECFNGDAKCGENAECTNFSGGFQCHCANGYFGDGSFCMDDDEWYVPQ